LDLFVEGGVFGLGGGGAHSLFERAKNTWEACTSDLQKEEDLWVVKHGGLPGDRKEISQRGGNGVGAQQGGRRGGPRRVMREEHVGRNVNGLE